MEIEATSEIHMWNNSEIWLFSSRRCKIYIETGERKMFDRLSMAVNPFARENPLRISAADSRCADDAPDFPAGMATCRSDSAADRPPTRLTSFAGGTFSNPLRGRLSMQSPKPYYCMDLSCSREAFVMSSYACRAVTCSIYRAWIIAGPYLFPFTPAPAAEAFLAADWRSHAFLYIQKRAHHVRKHAPAVRYRSLCTL